MDRKTDTATPETKQKKHRNRFNRLTSKEWLPFQKSWFRFSDKEKLYRENLRFFTPADDPGSTVFYQGNDSPLCRQVAEIENLTVTENADRPLHFALVDLTGLVKPGITVAGYKKLREELMPQLEDIYRQLAHRRFLAVFIPNVQNGDTYLPFAWDLAKRIATIFSLKDEKIACLEDEPEGQAQHFFQPTKSFFYCLYFRKDEQSSGTYQEPSFDFFHNNIQPAANRFLSSIPAWFILKPQPRKKHEILHPAKYPEDLPELFLPPFTKEGDNVFDPMSGTGSTQLAALKMNRNGYGTELSEFFAGIAQQRCTSFLSSGEASVTCKIVHADARGATRQNFPLMDYIITSPPYWDMLNMKGAENQAKRIEKGLQTNYSDDEADLGNIAAYQDFLQELTEIYLQLIPMMKPGSFLTVVVKNIKKKGRNYPFAWDLALALQDHLVLLPEVFWCQDDISIAPYGYGNTWVSNTFHQYCLTFQKPF